MKHRKNHMNGRMMKILFLVSLISIFFFPFLVSSDIRDDIKSALEEQGLEVLSVSEPDVLVPDQDITFEMKDVKSLKSGKNRLALSLFYRNAPYMTASVEVRIAGEDQPDNPGWKNRKFRQQNSSGDWTVRKGDKVNLVLRKEGLVIKTEGKVLENGRKNEKVSALNRFSNKTVKGLVIDNGNILVLD